MANIKEVAEIAGVSTATVSRVLNANGTAPSVREETARRVRQAAARINYRGNYHVAAMRRGRADVIGFTMHPSTLMRPDDAGRWYFHELRDGIEAALDTFGVSMMGVRPARTETAVQRGAKLVAKRQLDALIVPGHMAHFRNTEELASVSTDLPMVVVDADRTVVHPAVRFDAKGALRQALEHLRDLGHRRLLWVGSTDASSSSRELELLQACWDLGLSGLTTRPQIPLGTSVGLSELYELVEAHVSKLLQSPDRQWTAVMAYSDTFAVGVGRALRKAGLRIPEDVSLVGFDNSVAESCVPPLTTIDHRLFEMGHAAGALAMRLFEASPDERKTMQDQVQTVTGTFIRRESTAAARAAAKG